MAKVAIWGSLRGAVGGVAEVEIEAANLRDLLDGLAARHPAMKSQLQRGVSVAIDGRIYNDGWFTPIAPDSEVVLLPRIVGG